MLSVRQYLKLQYKLVLMTSLLPVFENLFNWYFDPKIVKKKIIKILLNLRIFREKIFFK